MTDLVNAACCADLRAGMFAVSERELLQLKTLGDLIGLEAHAPPTPRPHKTLAAVH